MAGFQTSDTMPKFGHVTDLREQWLVRADGALANRLQDREISSHLCENRYRNQQIREDFPIALNEQRDIEHEVYLRELTRLRQAEIDAEIAREIAEINLRRQRRQHNSDALSQPSSSRAAPPAPLPVPNDDLNPEELGLSPEELEEMRRRIEQEEKDARLAQELSSKDNNQDALLADMRCAVEAQDGELARLLQEREYKKLQRAKEKARQKALLKKQQRMAAQQHYHHQLPPSNEPEPNPQATLCDAYSNPRDMIRENRLRLCKSVDSDLHYVEPFEKESIQSKASALQSLEISNQYYSEQSEAGTSGGKSHSHSRSLEDKRVSHNHTPIQYRQPPPPPTTGKKPRFPDPVSIRPASHYPTDNMLPDSSPPSNLPHSYSENNNLYSSTYPPDVSPLHAEQENYDSSKRFSVISDITAEGLAKKQSKQAELNKKRKGCKIQ